MIEKENKRLQRPDRLLMRIRDKSERYVTKEKFTEEEKKERHEWRCQQKRESKARKKKERDERKEK